MASAYPQHGAQAGPATHGYSTPAAHGPPPAPVKMHGTVHRAPTPPQGQNVRVHRAGGGAAPPHFEFKKPGLDNVWQRMTNVRSWYSHLTSFIATVVISLMIFVWLKPSYIMLKTDEGIVTDNISLAKLFVSCSVIGVVVVGIGLWANGLP